MTRRVATRTEAARPVATVVRGLPSLSLSLQFAREPGMDAHRAALPRARVMRCLRRALVRPAELTVRIVGAEEGRALNRDYRGKDYATNVLTFDYAHEPVVTADLVLCAPVVAQEAQAMGIPLADHCAHLLVHGALHAQGWDHEDAGEAAAMEAHETALLATLGVPDPYAAR
jgi:probable rRNA maturation factor